MAKKKPAQKKKKAPAAKTGPGNKTILSFLLLPIAFIIASIAVAGFLLISTQAEPVNKRHQMAMVETIAAQYESYVNNVLLQQTALMTQLASSKEVAVLIEAGSAEDIAEAEATLAGQMPEGLSVQLFKLRQALARPESSPPLSHAGLDMIRRAEQGQKIHMEAHQSNGSAYLQSVSAVRSDSGRLIGTVSVSQSLSYLKNQLGGINDSMGNLVIQQQFENSPAQELVTYGVKNNNDVITLQSDNVNWTLTFQPADQLAYASVISTTFMWFIFAILIVCTALPVFLTAQRLQQTLRHDANEFAKQIQSLLSGGQRTANSDFEFAIFSTLAKSVNRMRMGKLQPAGGQSKSAVLDAVLGQTQPSDDTTDFDVPMMDTDNDLLGMNQPAQEAAKQISVPANIFRKYDILGVFGQTLTVETAAQIGMAIGSEAYDRGEQSIIVGRDGRLSSPEISAALIKGITASGRDVVDIGIMPTPVVYFACEQLKIPSCVVVTGSHSPGNHNGFKIVLAGNALIDDEITGLFHRIENQNFLTGAGTSKVQDVSAAYLSRISGDVKSKRPLKVVIDCGNGVPGNLAPQLVKGIGCHVLPLFCDIDGNFPNHAPDPTDPKNLQDLTRTVVETRADLGIAFDGDGDRLGIVTNSGKVVYADRLLMLLAKQVVQANPGSSVIFDVKSSRRLKNLIIGFGGKPIMWKTGHSYIKRKMKETGALLAGEMSGHIFYQDRWYGFDDAMYVAARLIEILSSQNETLDTLLSELPADLATPELSIGSTDERKYRVVEALQRNGQFSGGQITDIDGVRVDFQDGWGLVRASNTTAKLVCRFEADNAESMRKIQDLFKQQLLAVDSQLQIPF